MEDIFDALGCVYGGNLDENTIIDPKRSKLRVSGVLQDAMVHSEKILTAMGARIKCMSMIREIGERTLRSIRALVARMSQIVHSYVRSTITKDTKMPIARYDYIKQIIKDIQFFKPGLASLKLPSGKLLETCTANISNGPNSNAVNTILGVATERALVLVGSAGLQRKAREVVGRLRVGSSKFIGTQRVNFILGEDLDPHPSRIDHPGEMECDRRLRLMIQPFAKLSSRFILPDENSDGTYNNFITDAIFDTGFMGAVCTIEQLVAMAHAEQPDGNSFDNEAFKAYCSNASINRLAPDILASLRSNRFPNTQKPDRCVRAFLDGVLDVNVDALTYDATSPVIVCHRSQDQWNSYTADRNRNCRGPPIKFYPYSLSGKPHSGIRASLDADMDHTYPIAVRYRSIVTRQPGCRLTHAYNVYMDGSTLYERNAVEKSQMCKVLIGNAKTGKSTQVEVVADLYPSEATGNISGNESVFGLQDFGPEKMLAYAQEMGPNMAVSSTDLQSAISCDKVRVSVKHGFAREFSWLIPIILAGNLLGPWKDTNGSLLRRLLMFMYLTRYEEDQNGDIKNELRNDIGPTIMCMFTTFVHVIWSRAEWANQAEIGVKRSKDQDMFSEPAPTYFLRTRLRYGHQVSQTLSLFEKYRGSLVFVPGKECHLDDIVGFLNGTSAYGDGGDGGKKEKIDQTTVRSCLSIMGCAAGVNGKVVGIQIRREMEGQRAPYHEIDSTMRLCALLLTGHAWMILQKEKGNVDVIGKAPPKSLSEAIEMQTTIWTDATEEDYMYALLVLKETESHLRLDVMAKNKEVDPVQLEVALWNLWEMQKISTNTLTSDLKNAIDELENPVPVSHNISDEQKSSVKKFQATFLYRGRARHLFPELVRPDEVHKANQLWDCTGPNITPIFLSTVANSDGAWGGKQDNKLEAAQSLSSRVFHDAATRELS